MSPTRAASTDPRAARVRAQLKEAAFALVHERRVADISVADITGRADVSRQVFYQHFRDRDDAVAGAVGDALRTAVGTEGPGGDEAGPMAPVHRLVDFAAEHAELYHNLYPSAASQRAADTFRDLVRPACRRLAEQVIAHRATGAGEGPAVSEADAAALTALLVGGIFEVIRRWTDLRLQYPDTTSPESARRMLDTCLRLLGCEIGPPRR
ncbi:MULTISPECIES: TetR/AcrR family transcriptional regulator [Streptomyces]|uniref:DNA-binding transcriptional regulator, AcrR family n=1 Tax=Streptomyces melanosporofaciens TaxID=67327 RepID=A0A1H4YGJ0_STRMJ|nr:TetR/AcrR family transcriptional regulator [Streptomyces melanosporofaciens]SED17059.1 DNA-binding transcriptional regulator, AcrR family [Streptomyces melanosporofaciens]